MVITVEIVETIATTTVEARVTSIGSLQTDQLLDLRQDHLAEDRQGHQADAHREDVDKAELHEKFQISHFTWGNFYVH